MTDNDRPSTPGRPSRGRMPGNSHPGAPKRDGAPSKQRNTQGSARPDRPAGSEPRGGKRSDKPSSAGGGRGFSDRPRSGEGRPSTERSFGQRSDQAAKGRPDGPARRAESPAREGGLRRGVSPGGGERPRRDDRPAREGAPRGGAPSRGGPRRDSGAGFGGRPRPPRGGDAGGQRGEREDAPRHNDPAVDADALPGELDRAAWRELKALTKENAEWVAGHLVMASRVVDDDAERAHAHAQAAARRAGRIPVVRETVGITAYLTGDFALALRELRTYRRLSGSNDQLPLMVDCERGLGRPDRALELASDVPRATLPIPVQVELAIARSGARLDMGHAPLALSELEIPQLTPDTAYSFSPALFDSYAAVLEELGREDEAALWGERADRAAAALAHSAGDVEDDSIVVIELTEDDQA